MPEYRCLVSDPNGKTSHINVNAPDEASAIRTASQNNHIPVKIELAPSRRAASPKSAKTRKAVLEFTEMMDILTESGLSLKDALEVAASINVKSEASRIASILTEKVRKGASFSQAIDANPQFFSEIYRGMVAVGDKTGSVERIFNRLATYLRERKQLADKISGAMTYPLMVLFVAITGSIGIALFILPRLNSIFESFGGEAMEQIQSNIRTIQAVSIIAALLVIALIAFVLITKYLSRRSDSIAISIDKAKLGIPLAGKFISSWETLNFAFAMETLAAGSVPVEAALEEASRVVTNRAYRAAILEVRDSILKGTSLSSAFPQHREFPAYMSQWMAVGERSGKNERVFSQIRSYFQSEVEQTTNRVMTMIEPALIVVLGAGILVLVIGIVVPLFSLYGTIL